MKTNDIAEMLEKYDLDNLHKAFMNQAHAAERLRIDESNARKDVSSLKMALINFMVHVKMYPKGPHEKALDDARLVLANLITASTLRSGQ